MTCPTCGANDWKENKAGMLCDLCFTLVSVDALDKVALKEIVPQCDIDDLPDEEEFHGMIENPWND
jgi:hypothetical protein